MTIPTDVIRKTGTDLADIAERMRKLSSSASAVNSAIAGCFMQGGVGGRAGTVASQIAGQAAQSLAKGEALRNAAALYEQTDDQLLAQANSTVSTIQNGYNVSWANSPAVRNILDTGKQASTPIDMGGYSAGDGGYAKGGGGDGARGGGILGSAGSRDIDKERNKIDLDEKLSASDVVTGIWENKVDDYRENNGNKGKKAEHENIVYSTTKTGTISILDSEFKYEKYTDYIEGSVKTVEGDNFYSIDAQIGKDCHHINFEATDGSGVSGEISAIGISAYGDGEFDLAKGNAYIKAGGGVSIVSAEVGSESEWGGAFLEVGIGAEASADIGVHNGTFTFDVTVPVYYGITAGVDFEINYETLWGDFCDTFGF